ncbi:hypothetical protein [uncultured Desulfosarcina sp.]|uniref:hypothetical protein n=1 Tax=uncultured Desulfosarcina sp. TaxID=218289 RepID=UPI0029C5FF7E|nr:hypothetical protein [uncultured Desulfosarcina sp.]
MAMLQPDRVSIAQLEQVQYGDLRAQSLFKEALEQQVWLPLARPHTEVEGKFAQGICDQ